jgi:hypothetical protein
MASYPIDSPHDREELGQIHTETLVKKKGGQDEGNKYHTLP